MHRLMKLFYPERLGDLGAGKSDGGGDDEKPDDSLEDVIARGDVLEAVDRGLLEELDEVVEWEKQVLGLCGVGLFAFGTGLTFLGLIWVFWYLFRIVLRSHSKCLMADTECKKSGYLAL